LNTLKKFFQELLPLKNRATGFFVLVLVLNEMVLVLEGKYWDLVDFRSQIPGFQLDCKDDRLESIQAFRVRVALIH
jgi:hypothetical protein